MITAGTYFIADMANLTLASQLENRFESSQPGEGPDGLQARPPLRNKRDDYDVIIKKNIFNSTSNPLEKQQTTSFVAQPLETASLPPLNISLIGTALSGKGLDLAIIKDPKEKEQMLYHKGDVIGAFSGGDAASKAKIVEIHRNEIVLLRGGKKVVLRVEDKPEKNIPAPRRVSKRTTPTPNSSGDTIRQVSEGQWLLDRRELDDALKNLPQLLTKARVIPSFKDGQPDGFRIFAIAQDSLYSKIGLQNGDILHRINGVDVKSPQNFMKVIEQLKDENHINVDLMRNNQKETFSYEIR